MGGRAFAISLSQQTQPDIHLRFKSCSDRANLCGFGRLNVLSLRVFTHFCVVCFLTLLPVPALDLRLQIHVLPRLFEWVKVNCGVSVFIFTTGGTFFFDS